MEDAISIDLFISHSVQDRVLADAARAFLERQGFRCWKAPDDILPGQLWEDAIVDAIEQSRGILLIWTQASQDSAQVRRELSVASACCKDIFPLRIGEIFPEGVFKFYLLRTQWIDSSSEDLEEGLGRIVGAALDNWSLDSSESGAMDRDLVSCELLKPAEACISERQSPDPALRPSGLSRYVMERRGHRFNVDSRALLLAIAAVLVVLAGSYFVQRDQLLSRFSGGYEQVQFALSSKAVRAVIGFASDRIAIKDILKEFSYGLDKVFAAADEGGLGQVPSILDEHADSFGSDSQLVGREYLEQCFALLGQQGSEVDAIRLSNQSLALGDSANAYFCRAYAKADLGHHRGAIADYTRALLIDPRYDTAYYNRGIEKSIVGNEKGAIADFDKAISMVAGDASYYWGRGGSKVRIGDRQGAISDFSQAIAIDPYLIGAYINRASVRFSLNDYQQAVSDYNRVLSIDPKSVEAYAKRGSVYELIGDQRKACADWRRAASLGDANSRELFGERCS